MGYYTYFSFNAWNENGDELDEATYSKVKAFLAEKFVEAGDDEEEAADIINELCDYGYEMKWYEYDGDMMALSKQFPDVKFELEGQGEDGSDWWVAQYWNGKTRCAWAKRPEPDLF